MAGRNNELIQIRVIGLLEAEHELLEGEGK